MKKLIVLILMVLLLSLPISAYASTVTEEAIIATVTEHDHVKSATVLLQGNQCIIAIQPQGVVTKSQYNELIDQLVDTVTTTYPTVSQCHITRSIKAYRLIDNLSNMNTEQRALAIQQLLERLSNSPMTLPHD